MRFCPFCSAENGDEASHCGTCARKLPPLPPRRKRARSEPGSRSDTATRSSSEGRPAEVSGATTARNSTGSPANRAPPPAPSRAERDRQAAQKAAQQPALRAVSSSGPAAAAEADPDDWEADVARLEVKEEPSPPEPERSRRSRSPSTNPPPIPSDAGASRSKASSRSPTPTPSPSAGSRSRIPTPTPSSHLPEPTRQPPPTRTLKDHDFQPPKVAPVPEVPESGMLPAVRYALGFVRARWQRRSAIKLLRDQIAEDTTALDAVLLELGTKARELKVQSRALTAENQAIDEAEGRRHSADKECAGLENRQAEENAKFGEIESDRQAKVTEAETSLERAQRELASLEAQRRGLRDKRKGIERQQKGYLKAAEEREGEAAKLEMGESRQALRRAAEDLRQDAAGLDPERQDIERRLGALEKPISQATAKVESIKAELESCRRSLNDAREGHRHRLAEIEAEQGRKSRELAQAEAEIQRRLVTLGTLINLNRLERPEFEELYTRIDGLRGAIGARSNEIDRLTAEREAYDRASLVRGFVTIGVGGLILMTLAAVLLAML